MQDDVDAKADCYSAQERAGMLRYQQLKDWLLLPLLRCLAKVSVTPDQVTLTSTLVGLAFCPLYFLYPTLAFCLLLAHLILDGLDGPLARHRGMATARGSFSDTCGDQLVVVATTVAWMYAPTVGRPGVDIIAGSIYSFLYTVVVVFAVVRNRMGIPYAWLIRPRNFVYAWFFLESIVFVGTWAEGSIDYVVWLFNAVLGIKMVTGFLHIRAKL